MAKTPIQNLRDAYRALEKEHLSQVCRALIEQAQTPGKVVIDVTFGTAVEQCQVVRSQDQQAVIYNGSQIWRETLVDKVFSRGRGSKLDEIVGYFPPPASEQMKERFLNRSTILESQLAFEISRNAGNALS